MTFSKLYLQAGRDEALRRFHPWVFSRAISRYEGDLNDGDVVEVFDSKKNYLATGHYHDGSIAVRIFSFGLRLEVQLRPIYLTGRKNWLTSGASGRQLLPAIPTATGLFMAKAMAARV